MGRIKWGNSCKKVTVLGTKDYSNACGLLLASVPRAPPKWPLTDLQLAYTALHDLTLLLQPHFPQTPLNSILQTYQLLAVPGKQPSFSWPVGFAHVLLFPVPGTLSPSMAPTYPSSLHLESTRSRKASPLWVWAEEPPGLSTSPSSGFWDWVVIAYSLSELLSSLGSLDGEGCCVALWQVSRTQNGAWYPTGTL